MTKNIKMTKMSIDDLNEINNKIGIKMHNETYINRGEKAVFICSSCGKDFKSRPQNIWGNKVNTCPKCSRKRRSQSMIIPLDEMKKRYEQMGYKLISYTNRGEKSTILCPYCHKGYIKARLSNVISSYKAGLLKDCGCQRFNKIKNSLDSIIFYWKRNAKIRNIDWDLTSDQILEKLRNQNYICVMSGVPIHFGPQGVHNVKSTTISIDRIDNDLDYTIDNIQFVHKKINVMRGLLTVKQFIAWCNLIINPLKILYDYDFIEVPKIYFSSLRRDAVDRNIDFCVTREYLTYLFNKNNQTCAVSGIHLIMSPRTYKKGMIKTASLDRIDNSQGYYEGNVQWVHKKVNQIKWDLSMYDLKYWCKTIADYNYSK